MTKATPTRSARDAAVRAVSALVREYPDLQAREPETTGLDAREARLAGAIYRATVQRWTTLEFLLNRNLRRRLDTAEPMVRAVLLTGAAQLLFMDRVPAHAAVDEGVKMARRSSGAAAGLVNAVLRKVAELVASREESGGFTPHPSRLPWKGGAITLKEALLPPVKTFDRYMAVATSHPYELTRAWVERFGREQATGMLLHSLQTPPTIVFSSTLETPNPKLFEPHAQRGFSVWKGERGQLAPFLNESGGWVQDPTAHKAVAATSQLRPRLVIDYCAGRGTKTRQLAHVHPEADIIASDPDPGRYTDLVALFTGSRRVRVVPHETLGDLAGRADLVVLDVPCSNTGVLARRVEARYRYRRGSLDSLVELQRRIIAASRGLLAPGGAILYSTCSVEPEENEAMAREMGLPITVQEQTLPAGEGATYHDGGYHALVST